MPISHYQHVLVRCETPNFFLVLVLDLPRRQIYGHHVLDLRRLRPHMNVWSRTREALISA